MIAAAPYNGFGMVGAAPSINVVSVRASRDGRTLGGTDLSAAVQICLQKRVNLNIKVISLSLGGPAISGLDDGAMTVFEDMVGSAQFVGVNVVAAAGNHPGPVDWPAAYGPVLAVGAAGQDGRPCSFAASGREVDLWMIGCPVDAASVDGLPAWAHGSSEAAGFVAGALTQLRQLAPQLTAAEAGALLVANATVTPAGPRLSTAAALVAAGLNNELDRGRASRPTRNTGAGGGIAATNGPHVLSNAPTTQSSPMTTTGVPARPEQASLNRHRRQLPKPVVSHVRLRHGVLALTFKNRRSRVEALVEVYARARRSSFPRRVRTLRLRSDKLRVRTSGAVKELSITYRDPTGLQTRSERLTLEF